MNRVEAIGAPGRGGGRSRGAAVLASALALLAIGVAVRVLGLLGEPLWLDEGYSAYAAAHDLRFLWQVVPAYETHPPFYYTLLHGWTLLFGDTLASLRAPGLLCGIATMLIAPLLGRDAARLIGLDRGRTVALALTTLALIAVSPWIVAMSREVRPYPVLILVYAAGLLALLRLGGQATAGRLAPATLVGFFTTQAIACWLHTLGVLYGAAMTLALAAMLLGRPLRRRDWLAIAAGHGAVALLYLPALLIALDQAPTWIGSTWLHFAPALLPRRLFGLYLLPPPDGLRLILPAAAAAVLAAIALARLVAGATGRRLALALLVLSLFPVATAVILSVAVAPVFIPRTMTAAVPPLLLLLAIGAAAPPPRLWLAGFGGLLVLFAGMLGVDVAARQGPPMQNWYGTVRWLDARFRPGDLVLSYPNEGDLPLRYAVRDLGRHIPSRPVPTAVPAFDEGWHPTGSRGVVSLPRARLRAIATEPALVAVPTVWLLRLGPWAYDKGDVAVDELRRSGRVPVAHWRSGPIDIIGLRRCSAPRQVAPCPAPR